MALTSADDLARFLKRRVGAGIKRSVRIVIVGQGVVRVEGPSVTQEERPAEVTVTMTPETLKALDNGRLDPITAVTASHVQVTNKLAALRMIPLIIRMLSRSSER